MRYPCHCCGFLTLTEPPFGHPPFPDSQSWEICPVCFWEDEDWQFDGSGGGANQVSLAEAKANFKILGAMEPRFVGKTRPPLANEGPS